MEGKGAKYQNRRVAALEGVSIFQKLYLALDIHYTITEDKVLHNNTYGSPEKDCFCCC